MPRKPRHTPAGYVYHVINRAAGRSALFRKPEDWRGGSLWVRRAGPAELRRLLAAWPLERPRDWLELVNAPWTQKELAQVRLSVTRNRPYGAAPWTQETASALDLNHTLRSVGRPAWEGDDDA